jgi:hypothetical protein
LKIIRRRIRCTFELLTTIKETEFIIKLDVITTEFESVLIGDRILIADDDVISGIVTTKFISTVGSIRKIYKSGHFIP